ncbi:MAG: hypothetical protein ACKVH8_17915 [Pirellulales bacterium]|jgi:hypothetical protein
MKSWMTFTFLVVCFVNCSAHAAPASHSAIEKKIRKVVEQFFPEAEISQDNGTWTAKHATMMFTIHRHAMTGEVYKKTDQREGPNFKGFILSLSTQEGVYHGQAVVPQTLNQRYWSTFIDGPTTEDGKHHLMINFSFGSRLDKEFKEAVFKALPKSEFGT